MKNFVLFFLGAILSLPVVSQENVELEAGQESFSDEQIQLFAEMIHEIMEFQQNAEKRVISFIENHKLDIQTFNALYQAKLDEDTLEPRVTPAQKAAFENIVEDVIAMQNAIQDHALEIIDQKGMDIETYSRMMSAYRENPEFREKVKNFQKEVKAGSLH